MMTPKTNKAELETREFPVKFDVFNPSLIIPKNTIGIYKITSPSGKIYIGQSRDIRRRMESYRNVKCKGQLLLHRSILKYGLENHIFEIVCLCEIEQLNDLECEYMQTYDSFNSESGLNLKIGGNVKIKISDETRKKQSDSHKGQIPWNKGIPMSPESIEKMRIINTGSKRTEEQKEKLRKPKPPRSDAHKKNNADAIRGKKRTEEQKEAMRNRYKDKPNPLKGKPKSPETIQKMKDFYAAKRLTPEYIEKQEAKANKKEVYKLERKIKADKKEFDRLEIKIKAEKDKKIKNIQKMINGLLQIKSNKDDFYRDVNGKFIRIKKIKLMPEEAKIKISLANKGKKRTDEERKKMSDSHKGVKISPETIAKREATKRLILEEKRMMIF